ncbi:MAG: prolipoprotein diacylglyceryl transferase [Candidatus Margulisbacteria bacterium]|nr:prolipoprotein diacylglyceryl transferase [Candidatus Margulisiibacteriota bacterium]
MIHYPQIDPVFFSIGPFHFRWYGLMYILGILLGFLLIRKDLRNKLSLNGDQIMTLATYIILGIILGGRLGYILFYELPYFLQHPVSIFKIWQGGMSFHGGAIGAVVSLYAYHTFYKKDFIVLLDLLGYASPIGLGLGRIGNFINGELLGRISKAPWAMIFPEGGPYLRHPSQLYEAFFEGFILFLLLFLCRKHIPLKNGQLFSLFLMGYGIFRFMIEFFREPDLQIGFIFHYFTLGQILCVLMILFGILSYKRFAKI